MPSHQSAGLGRPADRGNHRHSRGLSPLDSARGRPGLCRYCAGRVLVDSVYRASWDLLCGAVEAKESPHAACRREVAEELGLDRPVGRVLAVDWVPSRPRAPRGLFICRADDRRHGCGQRGFSHYPVRVSFPNRSTEIRAHALVR